MEGIAFGIAMASFLCGLYASYQADVAAELSYGRAAQFYNRLSVAGLVICLIALITAAVLV